MATAKDIILRPIPAGEASALVKRIHYSGKVTQNSQLHIGVYLGGKLEGAMQFGPPLDRRKLLGLVEGTKWNAMMELNRMAFSERLPRNSESRALAIAMKMIRKHRPDIEWIVSFADGTQCGDGTIYRAAGFVLTSVRPNTDCWIGPEIAPITLPAYLQTAYNEFVRRHGTIFHNMTLQGGERHSREQKSLRNAYYGYNGGGVSKKALIDLGCKQLVGFQLRYIYFVNPAARQRLTVPIIPFDEINRRGAGMYRGKPRAGSDTCDTSAIHAEKGDSLSTPALLSHGPSQT